ncbi:MAG TPA: hypothetical protein VFW33_23545, partial [Gemmataceae bacterium]|nr:hypothetical protein [Gemmataceae bacterium]
MSISWVQNLAVATSGSVAQGTLQSAAFGSANAAGNSIIVAVWLYGGNVTVTSVTDTQGNTYVQDLTEVGGDGATRCSVWRADNIAGGAGNKITAVASGGCYLTFTAAEFAVGAHGLAVDASVVSWGATPYQGLSYPPKTSALTTLTANALLVATFACGGISAIGTHPFAFTDVGDNTSGGAGEDGSACYEIVSSTQSGLIASWGVTFPGGTRVWATCFVAYKESAPASPWQPFARRDPNPAPEPDLPPQTWRWLPPPAPAPIPPSGFTVWQPFARRDPNAQPEPEPPPQTPRRWLERGLRPWHPFRVPDPNPAPPPEFFDTPRRVTWQPKVVIKHVAQRVTVRQSDASLSPAVYPLVPRAQPLSFARAPSGDLFMASGLTPMLKWDGVRYTAQAVGVAPPTTGLTLSQLSAATSGKAPVTLNADGSITVNVPVNIDTSGNVSGYLGGAGGVQASVTGTVRSLGVVALTLDQAASNFIPTTATVLFPGQTPADFFDTTSPTYGGGLTTFPLTLIAAGTVAGLTGSVAGSFGPPSPALTIPLNGGGNDYVYPTPPFAYPGYVSVTVASVGSATFTGTLTAPSVTQDFVFDGAAGQLVNTSTLAAQQIGTFSGRVSVAASVQQSANPPLSGTYTAYQRFIDADGNPSNLSPVSNTLAANNAARILYTNVPVPTDPKVVRRQLLRNTSGQATTYYVAVDTTDLQATSFADALSDETLANQEAVPLFDTTGDSLANRYTVPPSDKPFIAAYLDRMFAAGEVSYTDGSAIVTNGSAAVTGIGTQWTTSLAGRFLYVTGVNQPAQISSVDPVGQTLTLLSPYQGPSDNFASYAIRPPPAERKVIYFSEPGLPEAWPATNGITTEQNGDVVTGLLSAESFLYILQRKHVYRLTYHLGPLVDGGVFLAALRGCVNNRSWVYLDGFVYMLDEQGVYRMGGGGSPEPLSAAVQDLFFVDRTGGGLRINWEAQEWFHALHCKDERTIRWFVALSGGRLPRHALCYNYDSRAWWVEEFAFPVGASCL